ncbi:Ger(x)C family spore germination protein [Cytobacillus praedii]|uniref:Ger(x)C family spore germination protein n=1 Tax=Cytobacillus praedii TaxID=1742358 RepID=UPI002E217263|nr:Ger(x)C family spore germination C-terminal domain-containing protein [Cytobacillus praedii]MED3553744.1 Ger(x)C family spore germination C-terminal domain-containing protein [Cytobacillus praedii]
MKKQKHLIKMVCLILLVVSLGGCWDKKEIERNAYVVAIGLDKGKEASLKITYLISNPEYGSIQQGGSTNEPPVEIISFETDDLVSPLYKANAVIVKEISYNLMKNIIVSEKLAMEKEFIRWMYDTTKEKDIRRDTYLIFTKEDASKFILENQPKLETRANKYFEFIIRRGIATANIPDSTLHRYLRITEADADLFLGIYATTEHEDTNQSNKGDEIFAGQLDTTGKTNKTQFLGSTVFKEGMMIGKLTAEDTRISLLLSVAEKSPPMLISFPDPNKKEYRIAAKITQLKSPKVDLKMNNGISKVDVFLPIHMDILTDHAMENYAKDTQKREELKKYIENRFEKKMMKFVTRTQEEFKADPFGWSLIARKKFASLPEYKRFGWMQAYPQMDVNISVNITFGDFGRQSRLPKLEKVRD